MQSAQDMLYTVICLWTSTIIPLCVRVCVLCVCVCCGCGCGCVGCVCAVRVLCVCVCVRAVCVCVCECMRVRACQCCTDEKDDECSAVECSGFHCFPDLYISVDPTVLYCELQVHIRHKHFIYTLTLQSHTKFIKSEVRFVARATKYPPPPHIIVRQRQEGTQSSAWNPSCQTKFHSPCNLHGHERLCSPCVPLRRRWSGWR